MISSVTRTSHSPGRWMLLVLLLAISFSITRYSAQSAGSIRPRWEPVAVAALDANRLAVLAASGEVELLTSGTHKPLTKLAGFDVLDLAGVSGPADSFTLLVASIRKNTGGDVFGALDVIPSGQQLRTSGTIYAGVALKPGSPPVGFVSNSRAREIRSVTFGGKQMTTTYVATIPDPKAILGPLTLDATGERLYVTDLSGGAIWTVLTSGREPELFATGLRDVRALAADDKWVFAADGDGRRILQFAQRPQQRGAAQQDAASVRSIRSLALKLPSAIAIVNTEQIAVGDSGAGAVFVINISDGGIARTIR